MTLRATLEQLDPETPVRAYKPGEPGVWIGVVKWLLRERDLDDSWRVEFPGRTQQEAGRPATPYLPPAD